MLDNTKEFQIALDTVRSWSNQSIDSAIDIAERDNVEITHETMARLANDAKARMNKKFNDIFGVNANGVRLF